MPFKIKPLTHADLDNLHNPRHSTDGYLSAAATDIAFPISSSSTGAARRNAWSLAQQASFLSDPSAHLLKVVDDTQASELVPETPLSLARWHYYTSPPFFSECEYAGDLPRKPASYPEGMHAELYEAMLEPLFTERSKWMVHGPRWVLTNLKTREPLRGRGAGTAAVRWGKCSVFVDSAYACGTSVRPFFAAC